MSWQKITCTEREDLVDEYGRDYNGLADPYGVISGRTDMTGEHGDPIMLTIWGYKGTEQPVLKDIRHLSPELGVQDPRPCEHYRWVS